MIYFYIYIFPNHRIEFLYPVFFVFSKLKKFVVMIVGGGVALPSIYTAYALVRRTSQVKPTLVSN